MSFSREISIYNNQNDELIVSYNLEIPIDLLIEILGVDKVDDPDVSKVYEISKNQYETFKKIIPNLKDLCENCSAFYECFQN